MPGKLKYLLYREGRYYARIVIPERLRSYIENKTELRIPLGADRRAALRQHPLAVAELMHKIALAEGCAAKDQGIPQAPGSFPMTNAQLALGSYHQRLAQDMRARETNSKYARVGIDDGYAALLRMGMAGAASDDELEDLVGHRIEHYSKLGNTTAATGTQAWRSLAMSLCVSEYEALERICERDEGNYSGASTHPLIRDAEPAKDELPPVSLQGLFRDYINARKLINAGREAERRWTSVYADLKKFLKHDDARRLSKKDLIAWRDEKLQLGLSPKTVSAVYLASVRTVLNWAIANDRLEGPNPAKDVRQQVPKRTASRERGYTEAEASHVIAVSTVHQPKQTGNPATTEGAKTTAARRWIPLLCAFSGARVTEISQLRKQDFRMERGRSVMRLSPDAGTIKTGEYRDVPLHRQVVEQGFEAFLDECADGPIFHNSSSRQDHVKAARAVGINLGKWLRTQGLVPDKVSPNHGFRHFFKTAGRQAGIEDRILDALQGHAARSAGGDYGDITLATRITAIDLLPKLQLDES